MTWIGRSAGESRASVSGTRPPATVGCSVDAEHVLHPHRRRWAARRRSRSAPSARRQRPRRAGPARRARRRAATAAAPAAARRGRGGRGRPGRSRRRGTAPATRRAAQQGASDRSGHGSPSVAPQERRPEPAAAVAVVHGSAASLVARTRRRAPRSSPSPGAGRPALLAQPEGVEAALDPLDELVARPTPAGGPRRRRRAARRCRPASTAAPRRMRAPGPLAVEVGGDDERRASPAGRRRRPTRRARCAAGTGRVGGDRRAGRGTRRAAPAPARRGRRRRGRSAMPARRATSAARRGRGATAPRSARSSPPARDQPRRAAPGRPAARRAAAQDVALVDEGGDDARQRVAAGRRPSRASRGCTGSPTMRRPIGVMAPSASRAPSSPQQLDRPGAAPSAGGGSRNDSSSAVVPHAASSSTSPARSTWVISAARWAGRVPCSTRLHRR